MQHRVQRKVQIGKEQTLSAHACKQGREGEGSAVNVCIGYTGPGPHMEGTLLECLVQGEALGIALVNVPSCYAYRNPWVSDPDRPVTVAAPSAASYLVKAGQLCLVAEAK